MQQIKIPAMLHKTTCGDFEKTLHLLVDFPRQHLMRAPIQLQKTLKSLFPQPSLSASPCCDQSISAHGHMLSTTVCVPPGQELANFVRHVPLQDTTPFPLIGTANFASKNLHLQSHSPLTLVHKLCSSHWSVTLHLAFSQRMEPQLARESSLCAWHDHPALQKC